MKKKIILFQVLYYILILLGYIVCTLLAYLLTDLAAGLSLRAIVSVINAFLILATPFLIFIAMRFSLLKWYVDPIAAACIPLYIYAGMILNVTRRTKDLWAAIDELNFGLSNDGGEGWFFLGGLFLFGLLASFSIARKKGNSISYRLLAKFL